MDRHKKDSQTLPREMRRMAANEETEGFRLAQMELEDPSLTPLLVSIVTDYLDTSSVQK